MVQPAFQPCTAGLALDYAAVTVDLMLWMNTAVTLKGPWFQMCSRAVWDTLSGCLVFLNLRDYLSSQSSSLARGFKGLWLSRI